MDKLKLIAFDVEDLAVISANLQDAVLKVGDMTYLPGEKRFAAVLNRFDWANAITGGKIDLRRRQSALRFERALGAKVSGLDLAQQTEVLSLLAIQFEAKGAEDPAGAVTLIFAGGGAVKLEVECIEAELRDLGPAWQARAKPEHPDK